LPEVVSGLGAIPSANAWRIGRLKLARGCHHRLPVRFADGGVADAGHVELDAGRHQRDLRLYELQ
jgi:hypothetical protein